jgi:hypothetical protein
MSSVDTPRAPAPGLAVSIVALLRALTAGARDGGLAIDGRTRTGIDEGRPMWIPAAELDNTLIPLPLLAALEERAWNMQVRAALQRDHVGNLRALGVLPITFDMPRVYRRSRWEIPREQVEAALARVEAFSLPATLAIDGGSTVTAIWSLGQPFDLRTVEAQTRAMDVQRRLARALGAAVVPAETGLVDLQIPIPGGIDRESSSDNLVRVPFCEASRVYDLAALERAIHQHEAALAASSLPATPRASGRRPSKETV